MSDGTTDSRVPVTVLTGFLGSGKTTLLNWIVTEYHGMRIAVIENEFGEIGIDDGLVLDAEEEVFEINNGCICCTVRGDLIRILGALLKRKDSVDAIPRTCSAARESSTWPEPTSATSSKACTCSTTASSARPWRDEESRRNRMVSIGRNLDRDQLEGEFRACIEITGCCGTCDLHSPPPSASGRNTPPQPRNR